MSDEPKYRKPAKILADFRTVCRANGYALAQHGNPTSVRDIDLVAVPWTPKAILSGDLIKHLASVEGVIVGQPVGKPHGRIGVVFTFRVIRPDRNERRFIDLSICPRQGDW